MLGNLAAVHLPDGTELEYIIDGRSRRIGKKVNGALVQGFLYHGNLKPVAELDANSNVVRVMEYDSFGRIISDSNPDFDLPVGFGGGLADATTGLVQFGFRDYDPVAGRWTARDPIFFDGAQPNLYVYAGNNPINLRDPLGLWCIGGSFYAGLGAGAKVCCTDDGCSGCVEAGVGVGGGVQLGTGGLDRSGTSVGSEVSAGIGLVGASVSGRINDCGKAKLDASIGVGPGGGGASSGKVGVSAKINVQHCGRLF